MTTKARAMRQSPTRSTDGFLKRMAANCNTLAPVLICVTLGSSGVKNQDT
jgi:hypothetical protein